MPGRKRHKARRSDDVEEQLRKQRLERQKDADSKKNQEGRPKDPKLGNFVYDPDRDAYFPKGFNPSRNDCPNEEGGEIFRSHPYSVLPKRSNLVYSLASEICSSASLRRRISSHWRCRSLLSGITVDEDWLAHFNVDLHSPPHHRGFSVVGWNAGRYRSIACIRASSGCLVLSEESFIASSNAEVLLFSEESFTGMELRQMSRLDSTLHGNSTVKHSTCGTILGWLVDHQRTVILCKDHGQLGRLKHQVRIPANDFSMLQLRTLYPDVITAHDNGFWSQFRGNWKIMSSSPKVRSDILTIENWAETNCVICGHRDGRPSLGDLRNGEDCWTCQPDISFGNISSLRPLDDFHVLAKNYYGVCRLYDIRMTSPVFHMEQGNRFCRGMCTDQANSVLIHPSLTDKNTSVLEVWSLATGDYIDAYKLPGGGSCELCPNITPGLELRSFGLWIGRSSELLRVSFNERCLSSK